jgi:hypothetical protein
METRFGEKDDAMRKDSLTWTASFQAVVGQCTTLDEAELKPEVLSFPYVNLNA